MSAEESCSFILAADRAHLAEAARLVGVHLGGGWRVALNFFEITPSAGFVLLVAVAPWQLEARAPLMTLCGDLADLRLAVEDTLSQIVGRTEFCLAFLEPEASAAVREIALRTAVSGGRA